MNHKIATLSFLLIYSRSLHTFTFSWAHNTLPNPVNVSQNSLTSIRKNIIFFLN